MSTEEKNNPDGEQGDSFIFPKKKMPPRGAN